MNRNNMNINRIDFCDRQDGISICDQKAAHIKWYIKEFVNEGNNVLKASDFKAALETRSTKFKLKCLCHQTTKSVSEITKQQSAF